MSSVNKGSIDHIPTSQFVFTEQPEKSRLSFKPLVSEAFQLVHDESDRVDALGGDDRNRCLCPGRNNHG